jgi:hypothetical protein
MEVIFLKPSQTAIGSAVASDSSSYLPQLLGVIAVPSFGVTYFYTTVPTNLHK